MGTWVEKCKDPRWQKKRLQILERDEWKCCSCDNESRTLHVHHIMYSNDYQNPWDYPDRFLVTLCDECHDSTHQRPYYFPIDWRIEENVEFGSLSKSKACDSIDRWIDLNYGSRGSVLWANWGPLI